MLAELERRLGNDDEAEAVEALGQLAQIALLRLRATVTDAARSEKDTRMKHVTTHILDTATGRPAKGVRVALAAASGDSVVAEVPGAIIAHGVTDRDGRLAIGPDELEPGDYTLTFLTGEYFARPGHPDLLPLRHRDLHRRRRGRRHEPAPARAAAAEPVRVFDLQRELAMVSVSLGANKYGKAENRVVRIVRDTPRHEIVDLSVTSQLRGAALVDSFVHGDNSLVVATDTQKNTVFAFAKEHGIPSPEEFLLTLSQHFTGEFDWIEGGLWQAEQYEWERILVDGQPHDHSFVRTGQGTRLAAVQVDRRARRT